MSSGSGATEIEIAGDLDEDLFSDPGVGLRHPDVIAIEKQRRGNALLAITTSRQTWGAFEPIGRLDLVASLRRSISSVQGSFVLKAPLVETFGSVVAGAVAALPFGDELRIAECLEQALQDIEELPSVAASEGLVRPGHAAIHDAKTLIRRLVPIHPADYDIASTETGAVCIQCSARPGRSFLVACRGQGQISVFGATPQRSARVLYESLDDFPDAIATRLLQEAGG